MDSNKSHPLISLGFILGTSLVIAVMLAGLTVYEMRSVNDVVSVTGSAKMEVVSDQVKWHTQISRSVRESNLRTGYEQIANDLVKAQAFLKSQKIEDSELAISPVAMNEVYQQDQGAEKIYSLSQTLVVQSTDVDKLTAASKNLSNIINQGVIFSSVSLEYYYSKLPDARIQLLSSAINDAKARATELAKNSGRRVGTLKSATSGVVQVQSPNSTDVSDYGSYDTSQVQKQITVTVKASFSLR